MSTFENARVALNTQTCFSDAADELQVWYKEAYEPVDKMLVHIAKVASEDSDEPAHTRILV